MNGFVVLEKPGHIIVTGVSYYRTSPDHWESAGRACAEQVAAMLCMLEHLFKVAGRGGGQETLDLHERVRQLTKESQERSAQVAELAVKVVTAERERDDWKRQKEVVHQRWHAAEAEVAELRKWAVEGMEPGSFPDIEALVERVKARGHTGVIFGSITKDGGKFTLTSGNLRGLGSIVAEAIREANRDNATVSINEP